MNTITNKLDITPILLGILSAAVLTVLFGYNTHLIFDTLILKFGIAAKLPFCPPSCEVNGPLSLSAFMAYLTSGVLVGLASKRSAGLNAIIAGTIIVLLFTLLNISTFFLPGQTQTAMYYAQLTIAVIVLSGIGGYIGKHIKTHSLGQKLSR